jgi:hypothetical protein
MVIKARSIKRTAIQDSQVSQTEAANIVRKQTKRASIHAVVLTIRIPNLISFKFIYHMLMRLSQNLDSMCSGKNQGVMRYGYGWKLSLKCIRPVITDI